MHEQGSSQKNWHLFPLLWKQTGCKHSSKIWGESFKVHIRKEMVWETSLQFAEGKERAKIFRFQANLPGRILSWNQVPVLPALSPHILSKEDNAFLALLASEITFMVRINSCNAVFGSEWSNTLAQRWGSLLKSRGCWHRHLIFFLTIMSTFVLALRQESSPILEKDTCAVLPFSKERDAHTIQIALPIKPNTGIYAAGTPVLPPRPFLSDADAIIMLQERSQMQKTACVWVHSCGMFLKGAFIETERRGWKREPGDLGGCWKCSQTGLWWWAAPHQNFTKIHWTVHLNGLKLWY